MPVLQNVTVHVRILSPPDGAARTVGRDQGVGVTVEAYATVREGQGGGNDHGGGDDWVHPPFPLDSRTKLDTDWAHIRLGDGSAVALRRTGRRFRWSGVSNPVAEEGRLPLTASAGYDRGSPARGDARHHVDVSLDTTAPTLQMDPVDAVEMAAAQRTVRVTGTARDDHTGVASVRVGVDTPSRAATLRGERWSRDVTLHGIGTHRIVARATDGAGNSRDRAIDVVTEDTGKPTLDVTSPEGNGDLRVNWPASEELSFEIQGTAEDVGTGVESVDWRLGGQGDFHQAEDRSGAAEAEWSRWRARVPIPEAGEHLIEVRCRDGASNTTTQSLTFHADDDPPRVSDVSPDSPHRVFSADGSPVTVDVEGGLDEGAVAVTAGVEWSLDGGDYQPAVAAADDWTAWHFTVQLDTFGQHSVRIRSVHASGTTSEAHVVELIKMEVLP